MAMGTPTAVYHGGMVHAAVRYYDAEAKRPGLPPHVAALVDEVGTNHIHVHLVNTDIVEGKQVVLQAGGCAEHEFTEVLVEAEGATPVTVDSQHVKVSLGPGAHGQLRIGLKRLAHVPSYAQPEL